MDWNTSRSSPVLRPLLSLPHNMCTI